MNALIRHLRPHHIKAGWPVYWRINLPFWTELAYVMGVFFISLWLDETPLAVAFYARFPFLTQSALMANLAFAFVFYLVGWPLLKWGKKRISSRFESGVWRAQFAVVEPLYKFNRAVLCLFVTVVLLIASRWEDYTADTPYFRFLIILFTALIVFIVGIFISLYGWLKEELVEPSRVHP